MGENDQQKKRKEELSAYNAELQRKHKLAQELTESERELLLLERDRAALEKEFLNTAPLHRDEIKKLIAANEESKNSTIAQIKATDELAASEDNLAKSIQNSASNMLQAATGIKMSGNALTGLIAQTAKGSKTTDILSKAFGGANLAAGAANVAFGAAAGIMAKFGEATLKAAKTTDSLMVKLGRQAGLTKNREQVDSLLKMAQNSDNALVSQESLAEATLSLHTAMKGLFGNITNRPDLLEFTEHMRGVGVEAGTTAELFGGFGKILGKEGIPQIQKMEKNAVKLARTMGISTDVMIRDLAELSKSLAVYGKGSTQMAQSILEISSATKISTQGIVNFGKGFEFYPDAIEKANQMNLIFGTAAIDGDKMFKMMNDGTKGPAEAFKYAMDSITSSVGPAFFDNVPQMRAFADSLGMSAEESAVLARDMQKAASRGVPLTKIIEEQVGKYKEKAEALKIQTNLQEKLAKLQLKFAVPMTKAVDLLSKFVDLINGLDTKTVRTYSIGIAAAFLAIGTALTRLAFTTTATIMAAVRASLAANAAAGGGGGPTRVGMGARLAGMSKFAKGAGVGGALSLAGGLYASTMDKGTGRDVVGGLSTIGGAAATGAMFGPWGALLGGVVGAGMVASEHMNDGIIVSQGGKISTTKINSADDVKVMAAKPGGPLAKMGVNGNASGPQNVEIVVSLFGQELVRRMVNLIEAEQGTRKEIKDSIIGS